MQEDNQKVQKAVALQYDKNTNNAPKITAKGKGETANNIIKIAKDNKIPIKKDEDLVELLSKIDNQKLDNDFKSILLKMQDEVAQKTDIKSQDSLKTINNLLTQIDMQQLTSLVSNSNFVYTFHLVFVLVLPDFLL